MAESSIETRGAGRLLCMAWLVTGVLMTVLALPAAAHPSPAFKAGAYPATLHASSALGNEVLTLEGGSVECAGSHHDELAEASTTLSLVPTYTSCRAFGFATATVTTTGCAYVLHLGEQTAEHKFTSTFDIACEAGKAIKVVSGNCEVEFPAQAGLKSVALVSDTEATPKPDITFQPNVTGLAYTVTKDGFACPFAGTGAKTGATFEANGPITLTGQSPSKPETKIRVEVG